MFKALGNISSGKLKCVVGDYRVRYGTVYISLRISQPRKGEIRCK